MLPFVGRKKELQALYTEHERKAPSMTVMYGRRRIGKTRLLAEFFKKKKGFFFEVPTGIRAKEVYSGLENQARQQAVSNINLRNGEGLIALIENAAIKYEKPVIILDEFPRLVSVDPTVTSRLQAFWDLSAQKMLHLVFCGSAQSIMKKTFLGGGEPLFGRKTLSLQVKPLTVENLRECFDISSLFAFVVYTITGGLPYYWHFLNIHEDRKKTFKEKLISFLIRNIYHSASIFLDEPSYVLREEVTNPVPYMTVLRGIAKGYSANLQSIVSKTGMQPNELSPYISKLLDMELVAIEKQPFKPKKRFYKLTDPFLIFWFNCIEPVLPQFNLPMRPEDIILNTMPAIKKHIETIYELEWRNILYSLFSESEAGRMIVKTRSGKFAEIDFAVFDKKNKTLLYCFEITFSVFNKNKMRQVSHALSLLQENGIDVSRAQIIAISPEINIHNKILHFALPFEAELKKLLVLKEKIDIPSIRWSKIWEQ